MGSSVLEQAKYAANVDGMALHSHNCYEILYIKEGELSVRIAGKQYNAKAPSLLFISKLEQHSLMVEGTAYKRYYLCISPISAANQIRNYTLLTVLSDRPSDFCHVLDISSFEADADRIFATCVAEFQSGKPYAEQRLAALLSELLVLVYREAPSLFVPENSRTVSAIWQIQCDLEEHCRDDFSLADIAEKHNMNSCYLSHLFRKVTGYSVMQYLTMCRLALARQLLTESDISVTDIVAQCGFSDSSNFSRLFRREMNMTPTEYRKKVKKK